jgi:hypothetical protein
MATLPQRPAKSKMLPLPKPIAPAVSQLAFCVRKPPLQVLVHGRDDPLV